MMDIQLELDADTSQALERCNTEQNPPCLTLARRPEVKGTPSRNTATVVVEIAVVDVVVEFDNRQLNKVGKLNVLSLENSP